MKNLENTPLKESIDSDFLKAINSYFDVLVNNYPIIVKSCKKYIVDNSHSNQTRTGRFILNEKQHSYLSANNGYYFFFVVDVSKSQPECKPAKPKICNFYIMPASKIKVVSGYKALTWTLIKTLV